MDQMLAWGLYQWHLSRYGLTRRQSEDEFYGRDLQATRHGRNAGLWSRLRRRGDAAPRCPLP